MSINRLRIGKQLELSAAPYSITRTNASNEQEYVAPGTAGQVLTIVGGIPTWSTQAASSFTLTDGTTSQVITAGDTLTVTAGNGITAAVSATDTLTITSRLSTDAGNGLVFGGDGGLYVPQAQLLTAAAWDDATNTITLTFANGSTVNVPIVDNVSTFLMDFTIAGDTGSDLVNNHETVTFTGLNGIDTSVAANTVTFTLAAESSEIFDSLTSGTTVVLAATPVAGTLKVYRNGVRQYPGATYDFTLAGTTITFAEAFGISGGAAGGEQVLVEYRTA